VTNDSINKFRSNLKAGQVCLGVGMTYSDPLITDTLGSSVDFFWIDLEHAGMSPEALSAHLLACRARGIPGIVRLPGGITSLIKPALDSGADGIIIPQVRTVEEVKELVADCRYPPQGRRGFGPRVPSNYFRTADAGFVDEANASIFVAVMIETAEAYEAIDQIVAVPGLDSVVLGPADLSWSLGARGDVENPKVVAAIETIIAKARAAGLFVGAGMGPDVDFAYRMAQRGVQWLQVGLDCAILIKQVDQIRSSFHSRWDKTVTKN
jgi:2-keto-3-deoxy-L-rhamnonate aldolase RhmA